MTEEYEYEYEYDVSEDAKLRNFAPAPVTLPTANDDLDLFLKRMQTEQVEEVETSRPLPKINSMQFKWANQVSKFGKVRFGTIDCGYTMQTIGLKRLAEFKAKCAPEDLPEAVHLIGELQAEFASLPDNRIGRFVYTFWLPHETEEKRSGWWAMSVDDFESETRRVAYSANGVQNFKVIKNMNAETIVKVAQ